MDELVKAVSQKTGLPEAQAKQAAQAVIDFLKTKLPAPIAQQLDSVLGAGGGGLDALGGVLKGFGNG
jgi:hypothetical protein